MQDPYLQLGVDSLFSVVLLLLSHRTMRRRELDGDVPPMELKDPYAIAYVRPAHTLKPGESPDEAALLAAVFGLAVLPGTSFAYIRQVFPQGSDSSSSGSSDLPAHLQSMRSAWVACRDC